MSREEAIKYLNEFIIFKKISHITEEEAVECFELAVEALQKQPCELLILKANFSLRQAELKEWSERIKRANEEGLIILPSYFEPILVPNDVEIRIEQEPKTEGARGDIPLQQTVPEMPQQKIGHWIGDNGTTVYVNSEGNLADFRACKCSECGEWLTGSDEYVCGGRFCPSCGIKMEEKK